MVIILGQTVIFSVFSSTASCCRGVGTSCLEETRTTFPQRWMTGGRRSSASRCSGKSPWWFATRRPIRAWRQMTLLPTQPHICLCFCPDAFCISQKMGRHGGLSTVQFPFTSQQIWYNYEHLSRTNWLINLYRSRGLNMSHLSVGNIGVHDSGTLRTNISTTFITFSSFNWHLS